MNRHTLASFCIFVILATGGCAQDVRHYDSDSGAIHRIVMPTVNSYVIETDDAVVLIDTGTKDNTDSIKGGLAVLGIDPAAIDLVLLTHAHMDHVGSAKALQDAWPAPFALHNDDLAYAKDGSSTMPRAQDALGAVQAPFIDVRFPAFTPDLVLGDEVRLDEFGVPGTVLAVPGHTAGSVALVLDSGEAFCGDIVRGANEGDRGEGQGIAVTHFFSDNFVADRAHVEALLDRGVTQFYPGHGPPFDADAARGWVFDTRTHAEDEAERASE